MFTNSCYFFIMFDISVGFRVGDLQYRVEV